MTNEEIIKDLEAYLLGELPNIPEYGPTRRPFAALRYMEICPDYMTQEAMDRFVSIIWPQVKKDLNIVEEN